MVRWLRYRALRNAVFLAAALLAWNPAWGRTPADLPMATPLQTLNVLYTDLAGLLGPRDGSPPVWPAYLSARTAALQSRLDGLEAADGHRTFRFDWLCQCEHPHWLHIPPIMTIDTAAPTAAAIKVRLVLYGGEGHTVQVLLVNEQGWKIDEIIDEQGQHFTEALERGIATHLRGRTPLP